MLIRDTSRAWRVMVLVVLAAVAFRPLSAFCRFVVEESRKVAVAAGFAPAREEVAAARPAALAEVERAPAAPTVDARPAVAAVAPAGGMASPVSSFDQAFGAEAANPYLRIGEGTAAPVSTAASVFAPTGSRVAAVRSRGTSGFVESTGPVPNAAGQTLLVDQADGNSPYAVTPNQTFTTVHVGDTTTGVLNHSAGTFTVGGTTSDQELFIGYGTGSNGTYNLSGTGNLVSNAETDVGTFGTGLFHQTGGTANFYQDGVFVGNYNGSVGTYQLDAGSALSGQTTIGDSAGSTGTLLLNGGTFTTAVTVSANPGSQSTGYMRIGENGSGTVVQSGGTFVAGYVILGTFTGSSGSYTLGGTASQVQVGTVYDGFGGSGLITQNGGTFTISSGNDLILAQNSGSQGSYNLNGGTLSTPAVYGGNGTGTFNFNGGTLQASASDAPNDPNNPTTFFSGVTTANVRNGGAVIDTQAFNVTVASALTHSTLGTLGNTGTVGNAGSGYTSAPTVTVMGGGGYGATAVATINAQGQVTGVTLTNPGTNYTGAPTFTLSGGGGTGATATDTFAPDNATDGGLTKMGAGTLTLSGTNTYTGATTINAGRVSASSAANLGNNADPTTNVVAFTGAGGELLATDNFTLGRNVTYNAGAVGTLSAAPGKTLTFDQAVNLTSGTTLAFGSTGQTGTVLLNPNSGTNYFSGGSNNSQPIAFVVNAGTVRFGTNSSSPALITLSTDTQTIAAGATLDLNGNASLTGGFGYNVALSDLLGGGNLLTGGTAASLVGIGAGNFSGVISGPGSIEKGNTHDTGFNYSPGTLTLTGANTYTGTTTVAIGTLALGMGGSITNNSALSVEAGGTLQISGGSVSTGTADVLVGTSGDEYGTDISTTAAVTLSAGSLSTTNLHLGSVSGSVATFTQSGGTNTVGGALTVGEAGSGTYELHGGTLSVGHVAGGTGTGTFNFNGGTLQAAASTTNFFSGLTTANVRNGGAVIDTNGFNVTAAQAFAHSNISGDNAYDGGLTKMGAGTLTLTGASTYTGTTTVNAGTLAFGNGGSLTNTNDGNLIVQGGGALTVTPGSSVSIDSLLIGATGAGGVTQAGGSVTTTPNTGSYVFVGELATGTYTLSGGSIQTDQLSVGVFANGTFTLSNNAIVNAGAVLVASGSGVTGVVNQNGGTVTAAPAGASNYIGVLIAQQAADPTFGAASVGTYNLNGGTLSTPAVTGGRGTSTFRFNGGTLQASASDNPGAASNPTTFFSGVTNTYVEAGGAVIDTNRFNVTIASSLTEDPANNYGSDGGLTKNGGGTLTMGAENLFYGPVTVNAGTLRAGAIYAAFGQGQSAVTIANVAGATLAVNGYQEDIGSLAGGGTTGGTVDLTGGTLNTGSDSTNTTFAGTITGSGGLTKGGVGMFTVTGNNTYTGTTVINSGALMVNNVPAKAGDSGTGSGPVYVVGGWLGGTGTIGGNVTLGANPPNGSAVHGLQPRIVSGSGTLTPGVAVGDASMPGRLTINGSLTFTSGTSVFEVDLAGAKAGTGYDQVLVGGNLSLAGTLTLTTGAGFTPTFGEKFFLIDLTGLGTTSGTFDGVAEFGTVTDSAGNEYRINYFDHDLADTSNLLFDDVSLTAIEVVPEPSTWALLGLGGTGLLGLRLRRRLRASATWRS